MSIKFAARNRQSELMDDPALDGKLHRHALKSLGRINWLSRSDSAVWKEIRSLQKASMRERPLTILDIAAGGGDLAVKLSRHARRDGIPVQIHGCDISSTALSFASEQVAASKLDNVKFFQCDVLKQPFPQAKYDIVMCSLFLHHLPEKDAMRLLQRMKETATELVLVDDLRRTRLGYWLAWLGCRILTRCHVVHVDGPMSVEGAFTTREAQTLALKAGLENTVTKHRWPQRFMMIWRSCAGES